MKIKTNSDKKKVESILEIIKLREDACLLLNSKTFATILTESYYEIIKELSSALILLDGFKVIGTNAHKELIDTLKDYSFSEMEISLLQDLRLKRNKSSYEGKQVDGSFLEFNEKNFKQIIKKLKLIISSKLK